MSTGKIEGKIGHPGMEQGCLSCSLGFISLDTINTIKRERPNTLCALVSIVVYY